MYDPAGFTPMSYNSRGNISTIEAARKILVTLIWSISKDFILTILNLFKTKSKYPHRWMNRYERQDEFDNQTTEINMLVPLPLGHLKYICVKYKRLSYFVIFLALIKILVLYFGVFGGYGSLTAARITKISPSSKYMNKDRTSKSSSVLKRSTDSSSSYIFHLKQESSGKNLADSKSTSQKIFVAFQETSSKLYDKKMRGIYDLILKLDNLQAVKLSKTYIPERPNIPNSKQEPNGLKETYSSNLVSSEINATKLERIYIKQSSVSKYGVRRLETCKNCFYQDFKYFIQNKKICDPRPIPIDLIILIFSSHENTESRDAIRESWLTYSKNNTGNVRYMFLFGLSRIKKLNDIIWTESFIFKDVLMADFYDSYLNLTYKTLSGFKWVSENYAGVKFVMKTDDDVWVNIPKLLNILTKYQILLQTNIGGACTSGAEVNRNRTSKWYVPYSIFPQDRYPGYCSGTAYVTSLRVASKIYEISRNVPFFHLEDVYVGLCMKKLGMTFYNIKGFYLRIRTYKVCTYNTSLIVTAHKISPKMQRKIWKTNCTMIPVNRSGDKKLI